MLYINEIAKILKISVEEATKVYFRMDIDFSECSNKEFKEEAKSVWKDING